MAQGCNSPRPSASSLWWGHLTLDTVSSCFLRPGDGVLLPHVATLSRFKCCSPVLSSEPPGPVSGTRRCVSAPSVFCTSSCPFPQSLGSPACSLVFLLWAVEFLHFRVLRLSPGGHSCLLGPTQLRLGPPASEAALAPEVPRPGLSRRGRASRPPELDLTAPRAGWSFMPF